MPPARSEAIFKTEDPGKNRNYYNKDEENQLYKQSKLIDVNDPRNEVIVQKIAHMKNHYLEKLLKKDSMFPLADRESFRHKLLEARTKDPNYVKTVIPQLNSELIDENITSFYIDWIQDIQNQEAMELKNKLGQQDLMEDSSESGSSKVIASQVRSDRGYRETQQRRAQIFKTINKRRAENKEGTGVGKQIQYNQVVSEFVAGPGIFDFLKDIFQGRIQIPRKLKPAVQYKIPKQMTTIDKTTLNVHIVRGQDVPLRIKYCEDYEKHKAKEAEKGADNRDYQRTIKKTDVQAFVEVRLVNTALPDGHREKERVLCTNPADGQCPEWNQILEFDMRPANRSAFTQEELQTWPYVLYFTLYDRETRVVKETRVKSIHYDENRYLGSFSIPLTTILSGNKFEGSVRVNRPLVLQNYRVFSDQAILMEAADIDRHAVRAEEQIPTYLYVSINLEPLMTIPRSNEKDVYDGAELQDFLDKGTKFSKRFLTSHKSPRYVKCFLENIEGKSVYIPRFLRRLEPPRDIWSSSGDNKKAIEMAARYVSLIPYKEDSALFRDMPDLTCTCQEFLDLGQGDSEEHAMLLCNYFNYIDKQLGRQ